MVYVSPVQKLYNTCNEVFDSCSAGIIPSPDNIQKLKAVLDDFKPADVGLSPDTPHFRASVAGKSTPVIRYIHIHECEKFSIGIFCLPPSGVIPLHNHPGMTVFSKLLFGTMHIKSYDWVDDVPPSTSAVVSTSKSKQPDVQQPEVRLAKVKVNSNFTAPCNTSILYPNDGGNMHCFTAVTACAVLDVLGPPYSEPDGRHCQYYLDFPLADFSVLDNISLADNPVDGLKLPEGEKEGSAWLSEREKPEDLTFVGELYRGPVIVEN
ncbi:2-aminoethanethiol dioxygenase [Salix suchowensis]|nr:2-aminoethanethiol dioxygenase [Salix suchowensis]